MMFVCVNRKSEEVVFPYLELMCQMARNEFVFPANIVEAKLVSVTSK